MVIMLEKLPHSLYAFYHQVNGLLIASSLVNILDVRHLLDFGVKSAVCFNLAWLVADWPRHRMYS